MFKSTRRFRKKAADSVQSASRQERGVPADTVCGHRAEPADLRGQPDADTWNKIPPSNTHGRSRARQHQKREAGFQKTTSPEDNACHSHIGIASQA